MAVSNSYLEFVIEQMSAFVEVTPKRMFGAAGLYAGEVFFGLVDNNTLYFKVDDSNRGDYRQAGAKPFSPYGDGSYSMSYYEVPPAVIEDCDELRAWFQKAIAVAGKPKKKSSVKPRKQRARR